MNKYQERAIFISTAVFVFFLAISLMSNNWGFFLVSLIPVFSNVISAFLAKNNKHIQRFNQRYS